MVFWAVTQYFSVEKYQSVGGICGFSLQDRSEMWGKCCVKAVQAPFSPRHGHLMTFCSKKVAHNEHMFCSVAKRDKTWHMHLEYVGSRLQRNSTTHLPNGTAWHPRRLQFTKNCSWICMCDIKTTFLNDFPLRVSGSYSVAWKISEVFACVFACNFSIIWTTDIFSLWIQ